MPRLRFSLLNLVFLMTCVAMAVGLWQLNTEQVPLRVENKRLNGERGTLVVEDSTKVNAMRVPTRFADNPGTFRVLIPDGEKYVAIVAVNDIPKEGLPEVEHWTDSAMVMGQVGRNAFATLAPGEHQVSLFVKRNKNGRNYATFAVGSGFGPTEFVVQSPKGEWPEVEPETYSVFGDGVQATTESIREDQVLVLLRR